MEAFIVFGLVLLVGSIGVRLGYDPVWFCMLCVAGSACAYLMTLAPIHFTWWFIGKLAGL